MIMHFFTLKGNLLRRF